MAFAQIKIHRVKFTPVNRASTETKQVFSVTKGERVVWASLKIGTRSQAGVATSTYTLGDGDNAAGFVGSTNSDQAPDTVVSGGGAYVANSGGKLYVAADTVDIVYTANTYGNVTPSCTVLIATTKDWA